MLGKQGGVYTPLGLEGLGRMGWGLGQEKLGWECWEPGGENLGYLDPGAGGLEGVWVMGCWSS